MLYASSAIFFANCTSKKLGKIFDKVKVDIVCFIRCPQDQKTVCVYVCIYISSVQSVSRAWLFAIPWAAARQASLSITNSQRCSNSCPSSRWCHPTTSSSIVPFSSCLQFFPAWGSFPMSQFFASGGQSIEASASASVLPVNIQDWFPLRLSGLTWENHIQTTVSAEFWCPDLAVCESMKESVPANGDIGCGGRGQIRTYPWLVYRLRGRRVRHDWSDLAAAAAV